MKKNYLSFTYLRGIFALGDRYAYRYITSSEATLEGFGMSNPSKRVKLPFLHCPLRALILRVKLSFSSLYTESAHPLIRHGDNNPSTRVKLSFYSSSIESARLSIRRGEMFLASLLVSTKQNRDPQIESKPHPKLTRHFDFSAIRQVRTSGVI
ncbi:hypothetical protein QYF36_015491 [Acer negundo]|nr:hypothetical protein QYF36_015491 [Acer negundo]